MLGESFSYPLDTPARRDALAVCSGSTVASLLLLRLATALWPDVVAVLPALLVTLPAAFFAGYVGGVLTPGRGSTDGGIDWSAATLRTGADLLVAGSVYLLPAVVALLATAYVVLQGASGTVLTLAPTVALLATVAGVYLLPAALATAAVRGVRPALTREAVSGLASGSYFFAWTVATSVVVTAWGVLGAVATATVAGVVAAVVFAYAHVVAARILAIGLSRSRWTA